MKKILSNVFYVVFIIIALEVRLSAQDIWVDTNGPNGGRIGDIGINSKDYLYSGGWWESSGLYRSTDTGNSWKKIITGDYDFEIYAIGINQKDHIFLGTNQDGLHRSVDDGETWVELENYPGIECWAFAFNDSGHVFAADGDWGGTFRSKDNGENWEMLTDYGAVALSVNKKGYVYAGRWDGLYRSKDNGENWELLNNGLPELIIPCIEYDKSGGIYVGTGYYENGDGVYYSNNDGDSWIHLGLADTIVQSVMVTDENEIYAGTLDDGVLVSSDFGQHWQKINEGLLNKNVFRLKRNSSGCFYTGSETHGGIFRSTDKGNSWQQVGLPTSVVTSIDFTPNGRFLFASTWGGIHRLDLQSMSWKNLGLEYCLSVIVKNDSTVFAGTWMEGLYKSSDSGNNWELTSITPDSSIIIHDLTIDNDGALLAATSNYPRISYNDGETWSTLKNGFNYPYMNGVTTNKTGDIFVWTTGALYRSTDKGASFHTLKNGFDQIETNGVAINDSGIFVGENVGNEGLRGIYRYTYSNGNWEKVRDVSSATIFSSRDNTIYAAAFQEGIIKSIDEGNTWTEFSLRPNNKWIMAFNEDNNGFLFVGTYGGGLYKTLQPLSAISDEENTPQKFSLSQNFPNPFNPTTVISYQLPIVSKTTLKIYDVLGREVATLVNEEQKPGTYQVEFDGRKLSSGVYFYKLQTGSGFNMTKKFVLLK